MEWSFFLKNIYYSFFQDTFYEYDIEIKIKKYI